MESFDITKEMVEISIGEYQLDSGFELSNAIASFDKHGIVLAYNKLLKAKTEATIIISQIASVLNLAILVSAYKEQNIPNQRIADETKIHIFRIKKANDILNYDSVDRIKKTVVDLANLDKNIKSGLVDKDKALDLFILNLIK